MNTETPKPRFSLVASFLARHAAPFTSNPFHHASSSSSTLEGGSDMGMPSQCPESASESESVEANKVVQLAVVTNSNIPPSPYPSSNEPSPSFSTKHSHDTYSPNTSSQNLHSAEAERWKHVMHTIDRQELGKLILGLAIPMAMPLVFSNNPLAMAIEMHGVAISLSLAFAAIWNGLLLREAYLKASTLILLLGIVLMMLAFHAFVGSFLPLHLKWIPGLSWFASILPLIKFAIGFIRTTNVPTSAEHKDLEKGEI